MCHHSGGPYGNQRKNGERSKAVLGLGLDEDYHSLDRHEGEGTPGRDSSCAKAQRRKGVCQGRTSEKAGDGGQAQFVQAR